MNLSEALTSELRHEAATTRKMLERLPQESLRWKPHEKSRTLGEVAAHIANLPGLFITTLDRDEFDRYEYTPISTESAHAILETFDRNIHEATERLKTLSDEQMFSPWRYKYGEKVIFELPRLAVIRAMALNHLIHHRGQLSVYLRLLDIPLPSIYGPTADEAQIS